MKKLILLILALFTFYAIAFAWNIMENIASNGQEVHLTVSNYYNKPIQCCGYAAGYDNDNNLVKSDYACYVIYPGQYVYWIAHSSNGFQSTASSIKCDWYNE